MDAYCFIAVFLYVKTLPTREEKILEFRSFERLGHRTAFIFKVKRIQLQFQLDKWNRFKYRNFHIALKYVAAKQSIIFQAFQFHGTIFSTVG